VVHRDVKPQNILLTRNGVAKLVDFGIARAGDQRLTKTGQVVGTVFYMSPEQINGKPIDGRSDQFSAAVVLYELLTGKVPFEGESTGATMMKIISEPMPPLRTGAPITPPDLESTLATALAKDPVQRFPDAGAFGKALARIRSGLGTATFAAAANATSPYPAVATSSATAVTTVAPTVPSPRPAVMAIPASDTAVPVRKDRPVAGYILAFLLVVGLSLILLFSWSQRRAFDNALATPATSREPQETQPSPSPAPPTSEAAPPAASPAERARDLNGTYDLYQDDRLVGEMTIFDQTETEFSVRAKDWRAEGHIRGREGYYDWRFSGGDVAGETGRTTFVVQPDGSLAGHVQGDKSALQWRYLARPRKKPAAVQRQPKQLPDPEEAFR
jgi:hypothetical protein